MRQKIGPVILDLVGCELSNEEREILQHPLVGGVILFSRNYANPEQLTQLCRATRAARKLPLLITVDQEGGRVQRFRDGFTRLPPMGEMGKIFERSPDAALKQAEQHGALMAAELLAVGIDLSFAPVLDLDKELNAVVGDRSFHRQPTIVTALAKAVMRGMHQSGMAVTGKHFPGHGSVNLDSHHAMPVDERSLDKISVDDLIPFAELIQAGINAVMPAHILFPAVDSHPVGFSEYWLKKILRQQLKFSGVIFSDDLNMEGAGFAGDYSERASAALQAGCDMVLICNNRQGAIDILDRLPHQHSVAPEKFKMLQGKFHERNR